MNKSTYTLKELSRISLELTSPKIIFLQGDLGAGKTTLTQHILKKLGVTDEITSPTYTYYNKYRGNNGMPIYHFDLYRLSCYDEFFAIGGEEILDNNEGIILIEWPDILKGVYQADTEILIEKTEQENKRSISIIKNSKA